MEEEANARQRQLEREIACLKDTIWRLTSRVCVVESFLKNKYGQIVASPTISVSQVPMKVIPIVIPSTEISQEAHQTEIVEDHGGGENTITVTAISHEEVEEEDEEETIISQDPLQPTTDFSEAFGNDFQPNSNSGMEELQEGESSEGIITTAEVDVIRIYKPELKTFVTVKAETETGPATMTQISRDDLTCHICQKKFSRMENVQRHMLLHRAVQFKCDECGREFNHQGNLNTHKLRHERVNRRKLESEERAKALTQKPQPDLENRKFPCNYCEKRFYTAQQRNIHTRIHTGEKPFECNLCGMRFNQKASLQDHSLGHVGEKNNYCHLCPAGFVRSRNLLKHIRQVHKMTQIKTILNGERVVEFVPEHEAPAIIQARKGNVESKKPAAAAASRAKRKKAAGPSTPTATTTTYTTRRSAKALRFQGDDEESCSSSPTKDFKDIKLIIHHPEGPVGTHTHDDEPF